MIVLDYIRLKYADSEGNLSLGTSRAGKELAKIINAPRKGFGLDFKDVDIEFAYNAVPPLNALGKVKKISSKLSKPYFEKLYHKIAQAKPDLVLGMGTVALEALSGYTGIAKKRGIPFQRDFEGVTATILPTYSVEYTWLDTTKGSLLQKDIQLAKTLMNKGIDYFKKGQGDYQLVDSFNKVKDIFSHFFKHEYPMIAVDFETNSLHGEYQNVLDKNGTGKRVSAKPIVLSLSWKEKMGVAIPLAHKDASWSDNQLQQIYSWIKQLFMDSKQWKVMHNGKFDITFLKETIGLPYAVKTIDTLIMYYIGVTEDPKVPKGLKQLAYQYTDMGGYEAPLDDYKQQYLSEHHQAWLDKKEQLKTEKGIKYSKNDYVPPVNEVDGDTFNYEWIPMKIIYPYAAADTDACLRIYNQLKPVIKDNPKWDNLIYNYYPKLQDSLTDIMANGLMVDKSYSKELKKVYENELNHLIDEIYKSCPEISQIENERQELLMKRDLEYKKEPKNRDEQVVKVGNRYRGKTAKGYPKTKFNFNSSKDKQYLFYNLLGYELPFDKQYLTKSAIERGVKEGRTNYTDYVCDSTHAMPYLVEHYHSEVAKLFLKYNKLNKALTSFIIKLPKLVDGHGLLHANFGMTNTVTSRLMCKNPNTQQLVRRTGNPKDFNYKQSIKGMFKSRFKGGVLVNIDFKTLEVYVAAVRSQDPDMEQALIDGIDFHTNTARRIWHIPDNEKVTGNVRSTAKAATFGTFYGQTPPGLAEKEHVSLKDAKTAIDGLMNAYPRMKERIEFDQSFAEKHGYIENMMGFRRRLGGVGSSSRSASSRATRQAFNADIQGSGAYCTNTALIAITKLFRVAKLKSKIVITVHDSVVIDTYPTEIDKVAKICQYCFSHLDIPEVKYCPINDLKVPQSMKSGKDTFRFPLHGEVELGCNYNDDVDYDPKEAQTFRSIYMYAKYEYAKQVIKDHLDNQLISQDEYENSISKLSKIKPIFQNKVV